MKRKRVGHRPAFHDQFHRGVRIVSLRDEDARAHRHAAVTSIGAMGINPATVTDRFERGMRAAHQFLNRDREKGTINGTQPQGVNGHMMRIGPRTERKAHVDDEPHAELAQSIVIAHRGHVADEEVIGDLREVHRENLIIRKSLALAARPGLKSWAIHTKPPTAA